MEYIVTTLQTDYNAIQMAARVVAIAHAAGKSVEASFDFEGRKVKIEVSLSDSIEVVAARYYEAVK